MFRGTFFGLVTAALVAGPMLVQSQSPTVEGHRLAWSNGSNDILDANEDGKISLDEILDQNERLFDAVDINGDSKLSVDEFLRRGNLFRRLGTTTLFDLLDVDGDGWLTIEELHRPSQRWFSRYDSNNDGLVEVNELSGDTRPSP